MSRTVRYTTCCAQQSGAGAENLRDNAPMQATEQLVIAARALAKRGSPDAALTMYEQALELEPTRFELHMEMAEIEIECRRIAEAAARLHALAQAYLDRDMIDEAQAVIAFIEGLDAGAESGVVVQAQTGVTQPMTVVFGVPKVIEPSHTEFCSQPVLLFPDGSPMPGQASPTTRAPKLGGRSRPSARRARIQLGAPRAPALRRPTRVATAKPKPTKSAPKPVRTRTRTRP